MKIPDWLADILRKARCPLTFFVLSLVLVNLFVYFVFRSGDEALRAVIVHWGMAFNSGLALGMLLLTCFRPGHLVMTGSIYKALMRIRNPSEKDQIYTDE